jgi:hypothetical protein
VTQGNQGKRIRQKPGKADNSNAPAQSSPDAVLISLPGPAATTTPEPAASSVPFDTDDKSKAPAGTVESSPLPLQFREDSKNIQIAPANDPFTPDSTVLQTEAQNTPFAAVASDNPAAATVKGSVPQNKALPTGSKGAPKAERSAGGAPAASPRIAGHKESESSSRGSDDLPPLAANTPSSAATGSLLEGAVKIAHQDLRPANGSSIASKNTLRNTASDAQLTSDSQQVKQQANAVGIASADSSADMRKPAATSALVPIDRTSRVDASSGTLVSSAVGGPLGSSSAAHVIAEPASTPVSHAAAAVEATLDAVEHARDAAHSSVELKLSFGDDTRLAVRVELRNGAVQTTFRTDSAELRQALANEWRQQAPAVVATASDRSVRIADPVFASSSGSLDSAGTSTGGHSDSRQPSAPAQTQSSFASPGQPQPSAAPAFQRPSGPARLPTSLRLNVFA